MAEKTTQKKSDAKRVQVKLPLNKGQNANQDEFMSVNFHNVMVKRGEYVELPECFAELIENNNKADEYAMKYVNETALREAGK